jgi:hypothetical protein
MNKSRRLRRADHIVKIDGRSAFRILTGKPIGTVPSGRPMRRWEDNSRIDFKEKVSIRRIY